MTSRTRVLSLAAFAAAIALILAPATLQAGHHLAHEAKAAAEEIEDNVENSEKLMEETYDKDRAEGEGVVEASGDAYEAVLEAGREKADE
jgi:hypothetical protein